MPLLENLRKCVARRHALTRRPTRVLFNVRIEDSFKSTNVPSQIRDLLVYIAREGVAVTDLFRRPGNPQDMKKIICDLEAGRPIIWPNYNFYTLANIAKRYLLHIEGGILGPEAEERLLSMLDLPDDQARIEGMHSVIVSQPKPVQQLLALLFGIWFRMIYHTEVNAMSVEAVAKSVAGSVFPSCTTSPQKVERASKVMEYLITGFASADLFSRELIEYFTAETRTSISRVEKFKYEFRFPKDVPREKSIRLFMRLLLEEGKKHGFHLIHDAVSKELFDNAGLEAVCTPNIREKYQIHSRSVDLMPTKPIGTSSSHTYDLRPPSNAIGSNRTQRDPRGTFVGDNVTCTKTSTTSTPTTFDMRTAPCPDPSENSHTDSVDDPVQQLSEKRTCVTTTPGRPQFFADTIENNRNASSGNPAMAGFRFHFTTPTGRIPVAGDQQQQAKVLARPASRTPACFNSVKRRQLERLQKRSDWFLSPPAGLRSSGLIHLGPIYSASSATLATDVANASDIHPDTSKTANVSPSSSGDFSSHTAINSNSGDSSRVGLSSAGHCWQDDEEDDDEYEENHQGQQRYEDNHDDVDEVDHLVRTDPHGFWTKGITNTPNDNPAKAAGYPHPAATSSPYGSVVPGTSEFRNKPKLRRGLQEEKENFPEVETRYYVVERYYGPEPRKPLLNRFKQSI